MWFIKEFLRYKETPDFMFELVAFLLHIWEILALNLRSFAGNTD